MEDIKLLTYKEVLIEIEGVENHLLIGNGFNYGLGINTGYKSIFLKMIENNLGVYRAALPMVEESGFDLEEFIGRLEKDIDSDNLFPEKSHHAFFSKSYNLQIRATSKYHFQEKDWTTIRLGINSSSLLCAALRLYKGTLIST
jgi:hypothetical protein